MVEESINIHTNTSTYIIPINTITGKVNQISRRYQSAFWKTGRLSQNRIREQERTKYYIYLFFLIQLNLVLGFTNVYADPHCYSHG